MFVIGELKMEDFNNLEEAVNRSVSAAITSDSYPENWFVDWDKEPIRTAWFDGPAPIFLKSEGPQSASLLDRIACLLSKSVVPHETRIVAETLIDKPFAAHQEENSNTSDLLVPATGLNLYRPSPSGGGLYHWDIYLSLGEGEFFPRGIYAYDPLHHALRCVSNKNTNIKDGINLLIVSNHWRGFFKYGNAYSHLKGLDVGVLVACLESLSSEFDLSISYKPAAYCLLDESSTLTAVLAINSSGKKHYSPADFKDAFNELPVPPRQLFQQETVPCRAAQLVAKMAEQKPQNPKKISVQCDWGAENESRSLQLEKVSPQTTGEALSQRRSGIDSWFDGQLENNAFRDLLGAGYSAIPENFPVSVFAVCLSVENIPIGAWRVDANQGMLRRGAQVEKQKLILDLQSSYFLPNVNLGACSVFVTLMADVEAAYADLGAKAFGVLDLLAGRSIQRMAISAHEAGCGAHVLFGMNASVLHEIYDTNMERHSPLLNIAIGGVPKHQISLPLPLRT